MSDREYDGAVRVQQLEARGMITLKGEMSAIAGAASSIVGTTAPDANRATANGDSAILWMAPDELLLIVPRDNTSDKTSRLTDALGATPHLAADVSDARIAFAVTGGAVRDVLSKLTPADLSPSAFTPGSFRRTRLAQVPAALWMRDDVTVEVMAFRSVAQYVFDLLSTAADPHAQVDYY